MLVYMAQCAKETELRELREEVTKLKNVGRNRPFSFKKQVKRLVEEDEKMEVEQLRKVDEFTDLLQDLIDARKEMWRQELQDIE